MAVKVSSLRRSEMPSYPAFSCNRFENWSIQRYLTMSYRSSTMPVPICRTDVSCSVGLNT
jgi:hypothetical protein